MIELEGADSQPRAADRHGDHGGYRFPFFGHCHHGPGGESNRGRTIERIANSPNGFRKSGGMMKTRRHQNCGRRSLKFLSKRSGKTQGGGAGISMAV